MKYRYTKHLCTVYYDKILICAKLFWKVESCADIKTGSLCTNVQQKQIGLNVRENATGPNKRNVQVQHISVNMSRGALLGRKKDSLKNILWNRQITKGHRLLMYLVFTEFPHFIFAHWNFQKCKWKLTLSWRHSNINLFSRSITLWGISRERLSWMLSLVAKGSYLELHKWKDN